MSEIQKQLFLKLKQYVCLASACISSAYWIKALFSKQQFALWTKHLCPYQSNFSTKVRHNTEKEKVFKTCLLQLVLLHLSVVFYITFVYHKGFSKLFLNFLLAYCFVNCSSCKLWQRWTNQKVLAEVGASNRHTGEVVFLCVPGFDGRDWRETVTWEI